MLCMARRSMCHLVELLDTKPLGSESKHHKVHPSCEYYYVLRKKSTKKKNKVCYDVMFPSRSIS